VLEAPPVAVRVGEVDVQDAAADVLDLSGRHTPADEAGASRLDVGDNEVQPVDRATSRRVRCRRAGGQQDRTRRAGWGQLNESDAGCWCDIHVEAEADLVAVEGDRAINVSERSRPLTG
jgi:hypothetical protein